MKPILFNTDMVRKILSGKKTVTRRVIGKQPKGKLLDKSSRYVFVWDSSIRYPPYVSGDILYVRETWTFAAGGGYLYRASYSDSLVSVWHPSIHMPKEAARIFLRVKSVRAERLQDITDEGAMAEGVSQIGKPRTQFAVLWETTIGEKAHAEYGWAADPWVWVIEFERCERPEEDEE